MRREVAGSCWNLIGVLGDGSCPELCEWVHCHNCPVYSAKGRELLHRLPPDGYVDEWTRVLSQAKEPERTGTLCVLIFRLAGEWLALRSRSLQEVAPSRIIHSIPHRSNAVFLGVANIRGELLLCASLARILGIEGEPETDQAHSKGSSKRMIVAARDGDRWVFPVDEVDRIYNISVSELESVPVTIARDASAFSRNLFAVGGRRIALLDEQLIFSALERDLRWQATT